MPMGRPSRRPRPQISSLANSGLYSKNDLGVDDAVDQLVHVERDGLLGRHQIVVEHGGWGCRFVAGWLLAPVPREVREPRPRLVEGVLVVVSESVAAAGDAGMHAGAAHLLERGVLADHLLGHPWRPEVHRGVALDHEHHVAEAGDVGASRRRRSEQAADLGHPPRQADLVGEDAAGAAAAGEQLDLVGDAGTGRVDQPEDGKIMSQGVLAGADHLLDGPRPPRAGLDGGIVGHHAHAAALDRARTGHDAVGGQVAGRGVGQQRVLDERVEVEEQVEAVAHEELALLLELGSVRVEVAREGPLGGSGHLVDGVVALVHHRDLARWRRRPAILWARRGDPGAMTGRPSRGTCGSRAMSTGWGNRRRGCRA